MEVKHWVCDKCAQRIGAGDRTSFKFTAGARRFAAQVDLCSQCLELFDAWLGPGPAPGRRRVVEVEDIQLA